MDVPQRLPLFEKGHKSLVTYGQFVEYMYRRGSLVIVILWLQVYSLIWNYSISCRLVRRKSWITSSGDCTIVYVDFSEGIESNLSSYVIIFESSIIDDQK